MKKQQKSFEDMHSIGVWDVIVPSIIGLGIAGISYYLGYDRIMAAFDKYVAPMVFGK